jgi:taurine transport system substrate-binding protein
MRRNRSLVLALIAALATIASLALPACGDDDAGGGDDGGSALPDSITIGQYTLGNPYGIAIEQGWFDEEFGSTKVEFVEMNGTAQAIAGLASGDLDIALIGTPGVATALAQGIDIQVPWIYEVIGDAEGLAVKKEITSGDSLKGKKIATPGGSTNQYALFGYLEKHGLTESDVELVDLGSNDILAAFERGDIDGGYINEPVLGQLVKAGGKRLVTSGELIEDGVLTADVAGMNEEFADEYPEAVRRYIAVLDRATKFFRDNPEQSYRIMGDYLSLSPAEAKEIMEGYQFLDAEEQAGKDWLGGGVADTVIKNGQLWEELERVPAAADEEKVRDAVVTDYLHP